MIINKFVQRYTSVPICRYESNHVTETIPPSNHNDFEILFVKEGCADFTVNEETYHMTAGSILLLSPYMLHGLSVPEHCFVKYVCLCFELSMIQNETLVSELENNHFYMIPYFEPGTTYYQTVLESISTIENALAKTAPFWELTVQGHLNILFAYLMQNGLYYKSATPSKDMTFCLEIMNYLEQYYKENISSEQAAEKLHYTQSYFCRLFKKNFGLCFHEYLCAFRLEKAKLLLAASPNISITDIVTETGFLSASYFAKRFREENGMSPKEFRKLMTNYMN